MFVDNLSVATGRPPCHGESPSEAHDVVAAVDDVMEFAQTKGYPGEGWNTFPSAPVRGSRHYSSVKLWCGLFVIPGRVAIRLIIMFILLGIAPA